MTASLLHDLGHLLHDLGDTPSLRGVDDVHQYRALPFLRGVFEDRYCLTASNCTSMPNAICAQSTAVTTLHFPMIRSAALRCRAAYSPDGQAAVFIAQAGRGRRCASAPLGRYGQVAGLATPSLEHFLMRASRVVQADAAPRHRRMTAPAAALVLTWPVVLAVLFGALLHASWNVLVKSSTDKALDTALIHLLGSLIALPLLLVVGLPGAASCSSWRRWLSTSATTSLLRAPTNTVIWGLPIR